MDKLKPYALFVGLSAILGHVAFFALGDPVESRFWSWVKIAVVFASAYFFMTSYHLERRCTSPKWVLVSFGAIGTLGTLLMLTQLGKYVALAVAILLLPLEWTGLLALMPYLHFAMLFLLLVIVNELRYAHEIDR